MNIQNKIFEIERPHPNLLKIYFLRCIIAFPFFLFTFPVLFFRYHTLRYNFDEEGISMRWGLLFRREINLTYSRIQDIHIHAGIIQRWFNLADLKIQTASGSADAEMVIEGLFEYNEIRDFLYSKMRGYKHTAQRKNEHPEKIPGTIPDNDKIVELLDGITEELKKTREAIESLQQTKQ